MSRPITDRATAISLSEPPTPIAMGVGVHGVRSDSDSYLLSELWCLHVYGYRGTLTVGGVALPIRPGYAGITPPGTPVTYRYEGRSAHLYVHFRAASGGSGADRIPLMQDLGERYPAFRASLEEVALQPTLPAHRRRARLWDLLGQLAAPPTSGGSAPAGLHPAVRHAVERIERDLGETLSVRILAHDVGVSYSYLSRLFQAELGASVVGYIGKRRMERAALLLTESTLPIKTIAAAVGIPDLHLFNKSVRARYGHAPRVLRARGVRP